MDLVFSTGSSLMWWQRWETTWFCIAIWGAGKLMHFFSQIQDYENEWLREFSSSSGGWPDQILADNHLGYVVIIFLPITVCGGSDNRLSYGGFGHLAWALIHIIVYGHEHGHWRLHNFSWPYREENSDCIGMQTHCSALSLEHSQRVWERSCNDYLNGRIDLILNDTGNLCWA